MSRRVLYLVVILAIISFVNAQAIAGEFAHNLLGEMEVSAENYFKLKDLLLKKVDHSFGGIQNVATEILSVPTSDGLDIVLSFKSPESGSSEDTVYYKQETYNGGLVKLTIYAIPQANLEGYKYMLGSDLQ